MHSITTRPATYLVRLLLNLDNMLPQLLRVLDPCFRLEERFFLRAQFQKSAIEAESAEVRSDLTVRTHDCRSVDFAGVW